MEIKQLSDMPFGYDKKVWGKDAGHSLHYDMMRFLLFYKQIDIYNTYRKPPNNDLIAQFPRTLGHYFYAVIIHQ